MSRAQSISCDKIKLKKKINTLCPWNDIANDLSRRSNAWWRKNQIKQVIFFPYCKDTNQIQISKQKIKIKIKKLGKFWRNK